MHWIMLHVPLQLTVTMLSQINTQMTHIAASPHIAAGCDRTTVPRAPAMTSLSSVEPNCGQPAVGLRAKEAENSANEERSAVEILGFSIWVTKKLGHSPSN
jgi:hypothetical protein